MGDVCETKKISICRETDRQSWEGKGGCGGRGGGGGGQLFDSS